MTSEFQSPMMTYGGDDKEKGQFFALGFLTAVVIYFIYVWFTSTPAAPQADSQASAFTLPMFNNVPIFNKMSTALGKITTAKPFNMS